MSCREMSNESSEPEPPGDSLQRELNAGKSVASKISDAAERGVVADTSAVVGDGAIATDSVADAVVMEKTFLPEAAEKIEPVKGSIVSGDASVTDRADVNASTEGKKQYDRNFMLQLQFVTPSIVKPVGLPPMLDIILNEPRGKTGFSKQMSIDPLVRYYPGFVKQCRRGREGGDDGGGGNRVAPRRRGRGAKRTPRRGGGGGGGGGFGGMKQGNDQQQQPQSRILTLEHNITLAATEKTLEAVSSEAKDTEELSTEELYKKIRGILNKLAPQKFATLIQKVQDLPIDTEERLTGCINIIFQKAVREPLFAEIYAQMAKELIGIKVTRDEDSSRKLSFGRALVVKCRQEFEKNKAEQLDFDNIQSLIDEAKSDEKRKQLTDQRNDMMSRAKRRSLGNISFCRFIGELFRLKMLTEKIMHECLSKLLRSSDDEDNLECLCQLLRTIGIDIDKKQQSQVFVNKYFTELQELLDSKKTSTRLRFMILDIIDLRKNQWIPRRDNNNPKTIEQIHKEAQQESQDKQIALQKFNQEQLEEINVGDDFRISAAVGKPRRSLSCISMFAESRQHGPGGEGVIWQHGLRTEESSDRDLMLRRASVTSAVQIRSRSLIKAQQIPRSKSWSGQCGQRFFPPTPKEEKEISEAEVEKKTEELMGEYLHGHDIKEAALCVKELGSKSLRHFVYHSLLQNLERTTQARNLTGKLHLHLVKTKQVKIEHYVEGLRSILELAREISVDIPRIWVYLGELISPMVEDGTVSLAFLRAACEPLVECDKAGIFLRQLLQVASRQLGRVEISYVWQRSGLRFADFIKPSRVKAYNKRNKKLELLEKSASGPASSSLLSMEQLQEQLTDPETERKKCHDLNSESVAAEQPNKSKVDTDNLKEYANALAQYIKQQPQRSAKQPPCQQKLTRGGPVSSGGSHVGDDGWTAVGGAPKSIVDPAQMKLTKQPMDENVQLGPGGMSSWHRESSGGLKTLSQESDRPKSTPNRFSALGGFGSESMDARSRPRGRGAYTGRLSGPQGRGPESRQSQEKASRELSYRLSRAIRAAVFPAGFRQGSTLESHWTMEKFLHGDSSQECSPTDAGDGASEGGGGSYISGFKRLKMSPTRASLGNSARINTTPEQEQGAKPKSARQASRKEKPKDDDRPFVFICYRSAKHPLALKLVERLTRENIPHWFDRDRIKGSKIRLPILQALDSMCAFVVLISDEINDSVHTVLEMNRCLDRNVEALGMTVDEDCEPELFAAAVVTGNWLLDFSSDAKFDANIQDFINHLKVALVEGGKRRDEKRLAKAAKKKAADQEKPKDGAGPTDEPDDDNGTDSDDGKESDDGANAEPRGKKRRGSEGTYGHSSYYT